MSHLTHANFVRRAAEVKEAVVHAAAATHQHIAGNTRVETAGDQRQHIFLSPNREAADTFIAAFHQQQAVVFDFQINGHFRVGQTHARRLNVLIQPAAHVAFNFNGAKLMLAATLGAHAEGFAFDQIAILRQRFFEDVVQGSEGNILHFQNMMDTRNTG
ncbi:hypothetical protein D3C76_1094880 [compost metagenome]